MDFSKVKLVVSDMDGTLLNPNHEVSARFFDLFKQFKENNIHFVAASGRQYHSIIDKLDPIKNEISVIAENGGFMRHDNVMEVLLKLTSDEIKVCVEKLRTIEGAYIVLCGKKGAYIESRNDDFISKFTEYYTSYELVEDLTKVEDDEFLKIAVFHFESSEKDVLPQIDAITKDLQVTVSGQNWLDISHKEANKGYALTMLQNKLGIKVDETLVFGDYNNDLQMLELAYFSYAMANAHPDVKKVARFETKSNSDEGVETIIEKLLVSKVG
ncbi:Cof-type HAD-IIB family hydrolase [Tamlana sp. 2_MG-2023]|uniref:Cof-type HAD-IIB family hydrolase n=1 Tax=unclassified Tamlana TaxID=2614803 RepID=UPI0026E3DB17|nr:MULTISPECIES: Cof-type HAD-IIB family hydrolase [unclassified Tamlana]MDO6760355.1 Cof-type HAD-IIB family hydrolase [Tamlana sp. 2_MG-2023]MDO6789947.1 Cof-type HAD-IIB family hydrolase [Tamlana sp. 1_MG-2023]